MKVLHVIPSLGPLRGGPSIALPRMAQGLAKAGVEVHIATTDDNDSEFLSVPLGIPVVEKGVTTYYFHRQYATYTVSTSLKKWIKWHIRDYDIVHIHSLFSYSSSVTGYYARHDNIPYVVRTLGHLSRWGMRGRRRGIKHLSLKLIEKKLLNNAAFIHFTSDQEREEAKRFGITATSHILPLGIDVDAPQQVQQNEILTDRYPQLSGCFVFLFLSRLHAKKGLDLLLSAFAKLHQKYPQTALVIAGDGEEHFVQDLHTQIKKLGLTDAVVLTGFVKGQEKQMVLQAADVFVLPSYSENFANVAIEAMAAGLPVILSDQVGVAKTIRDADAGIVIPCDITKLYKAMELLINDADLMQEFGSVGKQLVQKCFSLEATTNALIARYEDILQSK